jgi:hypothetical protein
MKKLVVILSVAVVALGGGAIYFWRQLDAGRLRIADLEARLKAAEEVGRAVAAPRHAQSA